MHSSQLEIKNVSIAPVALIRVVILASTRSRLKREKNAKFAKFVIFTRLENDFEKLVSFLSYKQVYVSGGGLKKNCLL